MEPCVIVELIRMQCLLVAVVIGSACKSMRK